MKLEVFVGAIIATLILIGTNLVALFAQDPDMTFDQIKQAAWVVIVGGGLLAFLKDAQAIWARTAVSKVTGRELYEPTSKPPEGQP